jgi:hypothetical protein
MSALTISLALRAAINVLRDSAESRKMPSGEPLDDASVQLHLDAAETLSSLSDVIRVLRRSGTEFAAQGIAPVFRGGRV